MRLHLFIPCFVDQLLPHVGIAMVRVLEKLGHELIFPAEQTCCGQPPFNSGFSDEARAVAAHQVRCFEDADAVVGPSGSCVAMMKVFYPQLFAGRPEEAAARALAAKTFEFSEFLVDRLGLTDVGAAFAGKVTFHDGCHGLRELKIKRQPRELLRHVRGLELVEMSEAESCCGFGGAFSVKFPQISSAMAEVKARSLLATGAAAVVSCDPSCLMQIDGYLKRQGHAIRCLHIAEVLAS
jgi:L-lactate dehydrogenase complex protein LldE